MTRKCMSFFHVTTEMQLSMGIMNPFHLPCRGIVVVNGLQSVSINSQLRALQCLRFDCVDIGRTLLLTITDVNRCSLLYYIQIGSYHILKFLALFVIQHVSVCGIKKDNTVLLYLPLVSYIVKTLRITFNNHPTQGYTGFKPFTEK